VVKAPRVQAVRPRLCLLSETFVPEVQGGLELHAYELAERLAAGGLPVQVLTRRMRRDAPARGRVGSLPVARIGSGGVLKGKGWRALVPLTWFLTRAAVWLIMARSRCDVVLALGTKVLPIPCLIARLCTGAPVVLKPESPIEFWQVLSRESLERMRLPMAPAILRRLNRLRSLLVRRADRVVAISDEIRRELLLLGVSEARIEMIPNGIDVARFHPVSPQTKRQCRARLGLPLERIIVIYTGRLSRAKGLMMLVEVWRELVGERSDLHLLIVGGGAGSFDDCESELRAAIDRHGLSDGVQLTGAVDDVPAYLQAADIYISPSEYEGFGLALIEAMGCGLPAVSTEVGIAADVLGDEIAGRCVPAKDPARFKAALAWLLDRHDDWAAMGAAGRQTVVARYSLDAVADRYLNLLNTLHETRRAQVGRGRVGRSQNACGA
jgi:glycosyltransferase involved in cell wall biosynthesis